MEYQASGDLGPLQPDTPQNSMRSLLNALLLKQAPNQVDMCGNTHRQHAQCKHSMPAQSLIMLQIHHGYASMCDTFANDQIFTKLI